MVLEIKDYCKNIRCKIITNIVKIFKCKTKYFYINKFKKKKFIIINAKVVFNKNSHTLTSTQKWIWSCVWFKTTYLLI